VLFLARGQNASAVLPAREGSFFMRLENNNFRRLSVRPRAWFGIQYHKGWRRI